jgi:phosphoribosyl 1,2-cyclic phosphodiesterase
VRYGGNTPCVDVRVGADGPHLVLDAGTGIRAFGAWLESHQDSTPVHLYLTHRHSDHVLGLAHFAPLFSRTRAIMVCCGDGEATSIEQFTRAILGPPMFPYVDGMTSRLSLCEWGTDNMRREGAATMHRFVARHPGDAAIYRVDDAQGSLVAYAPDNELAYHDGSASLAAWRRELATFLRDVPILVHDATYHDDELPRHRGWGHSSSTEATRLAIECGTGTLVLFHHHPDRDDDALERMVDESRAFAEREGVRLRVLAAWEGLGLSV